MSLVIGTASLTKKYAGYWAGTHAEIISVRKVTGKTTHVDLRFADGNTVREVPIKCIEVPT